MTIHRLPRYLHYMKHHLINRINSLFHKSSNIPFHHLRKKYIKPTNPTYKEVSRMITKLPASRTQILKTTNHLVLHVLSGLYTHIMSKILIIWMDQKYKPHRTCSTRWLVVFSVCVHVCVPAINWITLSILHYYLTLPHLHCFYHPCDCYRYNRIEYLH